MTGAAPADSLTELRAAVPGSLLQPTLDGAPVAAPRTIVRGEGVHPAICGLLSLGQQGETIMDSLRAIRGADPDAGFP
jgi:hypothetical protein